MSNKPLQYEPLKTVLQFMEPNLRFQLAQRLPSIRVTEKIVPLKFEKLTFGKLSVEVNGTKYRLSVYREYPIGQVVPKMHEDENRRGGTRHDLDQHGFNNWTHEVTPGDVEFGKDKRETHYQDSQEKLEKHLDLYQKALALRLDQVGERGQSSATVNFGAMNDNPDATEEERDQLEQDRLGLLLRLSTETLQRHIETYQTQLQPYICRDTNSPPVFTPLIQLIVESPRGNHHQRFPYTLSLYQAMKNLNTRFFGRRRQMINVQRLHLSASKMTVPLPIGLKIRIRSLRMMTGVETTCDDMKDIIVEDSYPLKSLTVLVGINNRDGYNSEIVKSARKLVVYQNFSTLENYVEIFINMRNPSVHIKINHFRFPLFDQLQLIQMWLLSDRRVGTMFSYGIREDEVMQELLERVRLQLNGRLYNAKVVVVRMENNRALQIVVSANQTSSNPSSFNAHQPKWCVTLRIIATPRA